MTVSQLDILQPKRTLQNINKALALYKRSAYRSAVMTRNSLRTKLRSQYMLSNAFSDTRRAVSLNEDIILACMIIIVILNFSATSVLANTLYVFMLSATVASELSGVNLMIIATLTLSVLAISLLWVSSFMQNLLTISFMEGLTRKRKRSLRLTIRRSLANASQMTSAWLFLMTITLAPAGAIFLTSIVTIYLARLDIADALPFLVAGGIGAFAWVVWMLANYTLFPYVILFGQYSDVKDALSQSKRLVQRRGRLFILSGYVLFSLTIALTYLIAAAAQKVTGIDASLPFLLLSAVPVSLGNIVLTILYRKRRLARY